MFQRKKNNFFVEMSDGDDLICSILTGCAIFVIDSLLLVILLPMSFGYLDFDEVYLFH